MTLPSPRVEAANGLRLGQATRVNESTIMAIC